MLLTQTRPRTSFPSHLHQQHQQQQQQQLFPHHQQNHFDDLRQPTAFYADSSAIDLDLDGENNPQSISSSPVSTQSLLSQYSNVQTSPLSTFDSIPTTISVAQGIGQGALLDIPSQTTQLMLADSPASIFANNDLMQTDAWTAHGHLTPKSLGRLSHQRESSLSSSLGSAGPASPYSQNTSNPHIAVSDSMGDGFHGLPSGDEYNANYTLVKSFPSATHDTFYSNYPGYTSAESGVISSYPNMAASTKQKSEGGLLPVPGHSIGSNRSRPVSVASSIASDSPATPSEEPRDDGRRKHLLNVVPKLDRTMTDIYSDELFNPNFSVTPTSATQIPVSPGSELFAQRLHAANSQHLGVGHSPIAPTSRGRSPFRHGSPLAPGSSHDFPMSAPQMRFGSVQQLREQNRAVQDARAFQQHVNGGSNMPSPRTISPKDAVLEFNEPGEEMNFPLFPQAGAPGFDNDQLSKAVSHAQQSYNSLSMAGTSFNGYPPAQLGAGIQVPQQYPFIAQPQQQAGVTSMRTGSMATSRTGSTELGHLESSQRSSPQRPQSTAAEGGTYTCTYHGCTLRFETPALLQKHKREGHRQAHGLNGQRKAESSGSALGMTSTLLNSQAGPHRCDRINPSTGKPCNTIFSRPYDLTRHEDTIHNARKQKVRCDLCNEEKTFSRADALTRHYRVCHPDVEFPGKHRRRGGHSA